MADLFQTVTTPELPALSQVDGSELVAVWRNGRLTKMPQQALRGTKMFSGASTPPYETSRIASLQISVNDRWRNTTTRDEYKLTSLAPVTWELDGNVGGAPGAKGEPGAGISPKGQFATASDLPSAGLPGDLYVATANDTADPPAFLAGDGAMYVATGGTFGPGNKYRNIGPFRGPPGVTTVAGLEDATSGFKALNVNDPSAPGNPVGDAIASKADAVATGMAIAARVPSAIPALSVKANITGSAGTTTDVTVSALAGTSGVNLARSGIAGFRIAVGTFRTADGAPWIKSNASGPMAIQDASGQWWAIDVSTGILNPSWFRLAADGADWGPAWTRAIAVLNAGSGGALVIDAGAQVFATLVTFPKGGKPIYVRGAGASTILTNVAGNNGHIMQIGDAATPGGGCNVIFDRVQFYGTDRTASKALRLINANGAIFRSVQWSNMAVALDTSDSYGCAFTGQCQFQAVQLYCWYSSTACHNLVWDGVRVFGCGLAAGDVTITGQVIRIVGNTNSLVIQNCDIETFSTLVQFDNGAQAPTIKNNYTEFNRSDIIYSDASINNAQIKGNLFQLGAAWSATQLKGGGFHNNIVDAMAISFGPTCADIRVFDNPVINGGSLGQTPWQTPPLTNSWTQQANYEPVGFRAGADGMVHLRGNAVNQTALTLGAGFPSNSVFTLPASYRPTSTITVATSGSLGACSVFIFPDGTIRVASVGGAGTSGNPYQLGLSGIRFQPKN